MAEVMDGLRAAISLNELADCLVGAKNDLAQFLHVHKATARKLGQPPSQASALIAERLDQSFQALKVDAPVLLSALQRELPSTRFIELPAETREKLNSLNATLETFELELASWATLDAQLDPTDCVHFTVLFDWATNEGDEPFGERCLRFRLPVAFRRNNLSRPRDSIQFQKWADRQRWLDLLENPPSGFEPCQLVRVLYEHGGLGWAQLALVREVQVSFAHSSTQRLSVTALP